MKRVRSIQQAVYITLRYHPIATKNKPKSQSITIPEHSYDEVYAQLHPILEKLQEEGRLRLAKARNGR